MLSGIRAGNKKISLMHYLAALVATKEPQVWLCFDDGGDGDDDDDDDDDESHRFGCVLMMVVMVVVVMMMMMMMMRATGLAVF